MCSREESVSVVERKVQYRTPSKFVLIGNNAIFRIFVIVLQRRRLFWIITAEDVQLERHYCLLGLTLRCAVIFPFL